MNFNLTTLGLMSWAADEILKKIFSFLIFIDGVIYDFIRYVYEIFIALTRINLFDIKDFNSLVRRIYVILGLVMLFVLAYSLLKAVINPDNFAKGETSFPKLIQNVVVSLVIIAFLPTIFGLAFNVQNALLNKETVSSIILGNSSNNSDNGNSSYDLNNAYNLFAFEVFKGFFGPETDKCNELLEGESDTSEDACRSKIEANGTNLLAVDEQVKDKGTFRSYTNFSEVAADGDSGFHYYFPLSTIAGIYVLYLMINFCFDIALRTVKLAFYQIIAPIPVICRVIPGGKFKDVFSKWLQQLIGLFLEVFVRIGAMAFGVLMLNLINNNIDNVPTDSLSLTQSGILWAFMIMAVIMFVKKIPELFGKIFPIDTSGMKLGIREKLAVGGGLMAGAALGSGVSVLGKKLAATGRNVKAAEGAKAKAGALFKGIGSTGAGVTSAMLRGGYQARGAKNFGDVRKAASGGISGAMQAEADRANRKNTANARLRKNGQYMADGSAKAAFVNAVNRIGLAAGDRASGIGEYFGFGTTFDDLQGEMNSYKPFLSEDDKLGNVADDLITRDAVSQSAGITLAAGGPNMSLDAMHEYLDNMRKNGSSSYIGGKVKDFSGNVIDINDERDYSEFLASLKKQLSSSERNVKKYLKTYAFQEDGFNKMQLDVIEKQKEYRINAIKDNMKLELDTLSFGAVNGKTVQDFRGNSITINTQDDYDNYISTLNEQYATADTYLKSQINDQVVREMKLDFGGGDMQRWNKMVSSRENINNLLQENFGAVAALYEKYKPEGTPPLTELSGDDAFDAFDGLITDMKNRNIDIAAEFEKLSRSNNSGGSNDNK